MNRTTIISNYPFNDDNCSSIQRSSSLEINKNKKKHKSVTDKENKPKIKRTDNSFYQKLIQGMKLSLDPSRNVSPYDSRSFTCKSR